MIIAGGTIELKRNAGGRIDPETGYLQVPAAPEWSDPIPCQYEANKYNNLGLVGGEHFTPAEYILLIEGEQPVSGQRLRLRDCEGNLVGEFAVIRQDPLEAVGQIRILVTS